MAKINPISILNGSYDRIKLGTGVVGKLTTGIVALFGVLGVIAFGLKGNEHALLMLAGASILVFLSFCAGVAVYAVKFPNLAALEGADLIKWRQMDMSARDPLIIRDEPNILAPPNKGGGVE